MSSHPFALVKAYEIVWTPTPALLASKLVPATPVPEKVPPDGDPPLSSNVLLSSQSVVAGRLKVALVVEKTATSSLAEF